MVSVKACRVTSYLAASSESSVVYIMKSREPSINSCGTEQVTVIVVDVIPAYTTRKILPLRYHLNKDSTSYFIPKLRPSLQ